MSSHHLSFTPITTTTASSPPGARMLMYLRGIPKFLRPRALSLYFNMGLVASLADRLVYVSGWHTSGLLAMMCIPQWAIIALSR
jgi:hypothetical protein